MTTRNAALLICLVTFVSIVCLVAYTLWAPVSEAGSHGGHEDDIEILTELEEVPDASPAEVEPEVRPRRVVPDPWPGTGEWAQAVLDTLSLHQKVGQLFATHAYGRFKSVDDPEYQRLVDLVERFEIGGVIFFQGEPLAQAFVTNDLQSRAPLPLLISQDMESGMGMRISDATAFPQAMALGATRNPQLAYAMGRAVAREARALGVHQNYAPVADVNNNPHNPIINVRSYGERPELVSEMNLAYMRGMQDGGLLATAKHFPGHGDTETDSHADLPVMRFDRARLDTLELIPFRDAIDAGVMSVMTGHLSLPMLEPAPNVPATLSPRITTDLLRRDLGFDGIIVTDALNMAGVTKHFGPGEAAVRALEAGADMLLMSTDEYAARHAILTALEEGQLSVDRINESVYRILRAKEWLLLHRDRLVDVSAVGQSVARHSHMALNDEIARQSVTLLSNRNSIIPLVDPPEHILSVSLSDSEVPTVGQSFARQLEEQHGGISVTHRLLDQRSTNSQYNIVLAEADHYDVIIVPTYVLVRDWSGGISLSERHADFLNQLVATGRRIVLVSFGNPYIAMGIEMPDVYITAYGSQMSSEKAVAQAILGKSTISGRLPISIPGIFEYGDGLDVRQIALREGYPEEVGMDAEALRSVDLYIRSAVGAKAFPGAAVATGRRGTITRLQGYGFFTYDNERRVTPQSRFDLASLTKVVATTPAAMRLYEEGRLDLNAPVSTYLPEFGNNGKEQITIWNLLTHTSGLRPFKPFHRDGFTQRGEVLDFIMNDSTTYEPGERSVYSDFAMITLGLVIERITGESLNEYTREHFFEPLGMTRTGFRPSGGDGFDPAIVPTELDWDFRKRLVQGEVHDESAYLLGGTAGHAGLFSTAEDLAKFAQMMVDGGVANGQRFFREETIRLFTTPADPSRTHTRALGWDTIARDGSYSSAGELFGPRSYGHTGFTGTSMWIDPDQQLFVILLSNRVYPTRENRKISEVRPRLADMVYQSIRGEPILYLPDWAP